MDTIELLHVMIFVVCVEVDLLFPLPFFLEYFRKIVGKIRQINQSKSFSHDEWHHVFTITFSKPDPNHLKVLMLFPRFHHNDLRDTIFITSLVIHVVFFYFVKFVALTKLNECSSFIISFILKTDNYSFRFSESNSNALTTDVLALFAL